MDPITVKLTSTGTTARGETENPHGLKTSDTVIISGASPNSYNGTFAATVENPTTFSYAFPGGSSPAKGKPVVTLPEQPSAPQTATQGWPLRGDRVTYNGETAEVTAAYDDDTADIQIIDAKTGVALRDANDQARYTPKVPFDKLERDNGDPTTRDQVTDENERQRIERERDRR